MLRFANFYADRRQTTDKQIALPLATHARTRGNYQVFMFYYRQHMIEIVEYEKLSCAASHTIQFQAAALYLRFVIIIVFDFYRIIPVPNVLFAVERFPFLIMIDHAPSIVVAKYDKVGHIYIYM